MNNYPNQTEVNNGKDGPGRGGPPGQGAQRPQRLLAVAAAASAACPWNLSGSINLPRVAAPGRPRPPPSRFPSGSGLWVLFSPVFQLRWGHFPFSSTSHLFLSCSSVLARGDPTKGAWGTVRWLRPCPRRQEVPGLVRGFSLFSEATQTSLKAPFLPDESLAFPSLSFSLSLASSPSLTFLSIEPVQDLLFGSPLPASLPGATSLPLQLCALTLPTFFWRETACFPSLHQMLSSAFPPLLLFPPSAQAPPSHNYNPTQ